MTHDVAIVGAGAAGLTAAHWLRAAGIADVVVLERDATPGGVPRWCGHPGFGVGEFHRLLTGPGFARALVRRAEGVDIRTDTTVLGITPGGGLRLGTRGGIEALTARAVLLATGIREAPRSARLVSGTRPWGVTTTGALQEIVYGSSRAPFRRPLIVGGEWVAFSSLLTCRHAGIRPVALIEESAILQPPWPARPAARALFGVPVLPRTRLVEIRGEERVEGAVIDGPGGRRVIACDGIVFTGRFVPEATLARTGHVRMDPRTNGPEIDNLWRCSDPAFFAAGNVLRPVETSGWAAREGRLAAGAILRALRGELPAADDAVPLRIEGDLRSIYPQRISRALQEATVLHARANRGGVLRIVADGQTLAMRRVRGKPGARVSIRVPPLSRDCGHLAAILE